LNLLEILEVYKDVVLNLPRFHGDRFWVLVIAFEEALRATKLLAIMNVGYQGLLAMGEDRAD